eukprot:gene13694-13810_t
MLTFVRRFLETWVAKLFFIVLVASFGLWGVADVVRNFGSDSSLAVVGSRKIELPEAQEAYRRQLAQVTRMFGTQIAPTPEIRRSVASQAVERLITAAALDNKVAELRLAAPDEAVRQAVFDIPAFKGRSGTFDRATFETVLRNNGLTEKRFLDLMRSDLGQRQMLEAIRAGTVTPDVMARAVFSFQREQRVAEAVEFPLAAAKTPEPPTEAQVQRYYDNNKPKYATVEYRRIKAVILSPETLEKEIDVSDADIAAAYEARKAEFNTAEKRSVQVLLTQDEAVATKLAAEWKAGADWAAMQKSAADSGASGVELPNASKEEFPAPELGEAVFQAGLNEVPTPVRSALGWHVIKVTAIAPGATRSLADMTMELKARIVADRAVDLLYTRANKVEDALSTGTSLDDLPGDLGLAAIAGTLDAQGNTLEGAPAPIPGPAELRPALIQAAFAAKKGEPAHLTQAPNAANGAQSFYAFTVEEIIPPETRKLEDVIETVRADWTRDAIRRTQEEAAAKLLAALKGGQSMEDAATVAGVQVRKLPPVGRAAPVDGVPAQLVTPLFGLKKGEATMVETPEGFLVAVLSEIVAADPAADATGYAQMREALAKSMSDDAETLFATAIRTAAKPRVNRAQLEQLSQAEAAASLTRPLPLAAPAVDLAALPEPESTFTREGYIEAVERAKEYIRAGDVFQVVPSQRFSVPFALPPFALYRALRRISPAPFLFFLDFGSFAIVGSSPEILVRLRDNTVTIRPLAGTRPRGATHDEDQRLAAELLADPKERAEHLMLLDLGRNDVGRVAEIGTVKVTESFAIERFSHVMHIMSEVQGQLRPELDAVDALIGGFPAGTLTGAPKVRAMQIIEELEPVRRGIYAGCIGYFAPDGTMDTCIALRTAVVKDGVLHIQAGAGVVADSDPEAEYEETRQKARGMFRAAEEAVRFAARGANAVL